MFVSPARFVAEHKQNPSTELSIHGVKKTDETGRLCHLNLAVNGLEGEIKHGGNINSYYDAPHNATGRLDFVLANVSDCGDDSLQDEANRNAPVRPPLRRLRPALFLQTKDVCPLKAQNSE